MQIHQTAVKAKGVVSGQIYARRVLTVVILPGQAFSKATRNRIREFLSEVSEVVGEDCLAHFRIEGLTYRMED